MEITVDEQDGTIVVHVAGEVDLECSVELRDVLLDGIARSLDVVVDLQGVPLIDSSGIASLLEAYQAAREKETGFVLAGISSGVMRVLKLARLEEVLPTAADVDAALKQLA